MPRSNTQMYILYPTMIMCNLFKTLEQTFSPLYSRRVSDIIYMVLPYTVGGWPSNRGSGPSDYIEISYEKSTKGGLAL